MEVKLYDDNLASPTFVDDLTFRHQNLRFSTKLNGGFSICSMQLKADLPEAWEWIADKGFYRLVITDKTKTLWEGRIQEPWFTTGEVGFTAYGYWASMRDQPYATAYNDVASTVIKAVLTAACPSISSDQTNIATTDITITSAADESYLDITAQDLVIKLLEFSDSNAYKWYFAIWEDRIPYLFARNLSAIDWYVSIRAGDLVDYKPRYNYADWYSRCYAVYESAGAIARTSTSSDTTVETRYGGLTRTYAVPNLGAVAQATAEASRAAFLANKKYVRPTMDSFVLGDKVYDSNGISYPSSWVRAGEVIRIRDLVPATSDLDSITQDSLRTFYITETEYDADRMQNRLTVDTEKQSLDAILARKLR